MTTSVTITGTGTPLYVPHRAGAGVLIVHGDTALQFDTGQATRLRMSEAGFDISQLDAVFITHHHSDHLIGLADVLTTRWMQMHRSSVAPLPVFAPDGIAADIAEGVLDVWADEIDMRMAHVSYPNRPEPDVRRFTASAEIAEVSRHGQVLVSSGLVDHPPVVPAVGYRIETPDGVVAVSGDTRVCDGLENLCDGADIAVCEVIRLAGLDGVLSNPEKIAHYHAEIGQLGAMAERAAVRHLVLTHLIPPPETDEQKQDFVDDLRAAGFSGVITVADDLTQVMM